ncbi:grasp-with-spasm system SPASM domain peptide maturase [Flavobacterium sp. UBA7680]|uniref:grasp-with-spasm system SPASM domain peptide maturase n=1 Tax=Flavobacterium sp. UBA7680 TaxID=1946559 RepID=UPI0025C28DB1|nr:grasp-with-spasm system SPASM domain peptide maturase [Flavobacterium sp. UBA7680]
MESYQFKLFQCCIPVKGIKNGIIVDFQRKIIHKVPNQIIDIIEEYSQKNIYDLFADYNASKKILKSYIRYFLDNELIILSNEISAYPAISNDFFNPVILDNICIEIEKESIYLDNFLRLEVNKLGLNSIKIILINNDIESLIKVLDILEDSKIKAIALYLEYNEEILLQLELIIKDNPRILDVVFYNFNDQIENYNSSEKLSFEKSPIEEVLYGKTIENLNSFVLDIDLYNEALKYNLMFNKTLFIDSLGNIKKYKEDLNIYGNIQKDEINEIMLEQDFNLFWRVSKDQIDVCKDCEFRYICPDNRIPYKVDSEELSYKFKTTCNYDPYQGKWN